MPSANISPADVAGDDNAEHVGDLVYDELGVVCPPHTTERHMVRRIDMRLMPFVIIMYLLAFLDRVNIANAKTFHLVTDLDLTGTEYNTGQWMKTAPHDPSTPLSRSLESWLRGLES